LSLGNTTGATNIRGADLNLNDTGNATYINYSSSGGLNMGSTTGATLLRGTTLTISGTTINQTGTVNINTTGTGATSINTGTNTASTSIGNATGNLTLVGGSLGINNSGSGTTNIAFSGTGGLNAGNTTSASVFRGSAASRLQFGSGTTYDVDVTVDSTNALWIRGPTGSTYYFGNSSTDTVNLYNGTRLSVNGTSTFTGNATFNGAVIAGYRRVTGGTAALSSSVACSNFSGGTCYYNLVPATATCSNTNERVIGGGCTCVVGRCNITSSYASSNTVWSCTANSSTSADDVTAYAVCARIQ
jgi:hypothetical protein